MPRAIRGNPTPRQWSYVCPNLLTWVLVPFPGVLIECEPAIKSIIMHLDSLTQDIIIEDIDDCRLVVKENMVDTVKQKLEEVSSMDDCRLGAMFMLT